MLHSLLIPPLLLTLAHAPADNPPAAPREFRAVWVATLDNIDWPSSRTLSPEKQLAEIRQNLDLAVELKLNAVILQVRAAADAVYNSSLEPWSLYLTGTQGQAPNPHWDPLTAWIDEAHRRGIELHAWLNPCRAHIRSTKPADSHVSRRHPELLVQYDKYLWFDPGNPTAVEHILAVFADVTKRYDIDGIHVDDYFYPYPVLKDGRPLPFPDDDSWNRSKSADNNLGRDDWRRQNVHQLVRRIHQQTLRIKPGIRFGISPFGIIRPDPDHGITGFDQYSGIYADPLVWLSEDWCDYLAPQLYWPITQKAQSFPLLLKLWHRQNPRNIPIWPGLYTSRLGSGNPLWTPTELLQQIEICRSHSLPSGHLHFSLSTLRENRRQIADLLKSTAYQSPALPPPVRRPPTAPPPAPAATLDPGQTHIQLQIADNQQENSPASEKPRLAAAWFHDGVNWHFHTQLATSTRIQLPPGTLRTFVFTVDRWGQMSDPVSIMLRQNQNPD